MVVNKDYYLNSYKINLQKRKYHQKCSEIN